MYNEVSIVMQMNRSLLVYEFANELGSILHVYHIIIDVTMYVVF